MEATAIVRLLEAGAQNSDAHTGTTDHVRLAKERLAALPVLPKIAGAQPSLVFNMTAIDTINITNHCILCLHAYLYPFGGTLAQHGHDISDS